MRLLKQLFANMLAFACASLVAGLSFALFATPGPSRILAPHLLTEAIDAALAFASIAALPTMLAVAVAGWLGYRGLIGHVLFGAAVSLTGAFVIHHLAHGIDLPLNTYALTAFAVAGIAAGMTFWLIAGRAPEAPRASQFERR
ncbi:MAG: hypothetical protein GC150_00195 [Rhizobiales bacterium]|nr:hypothetical protein [Hyphomicrobiales bacterium]